MRMTSQSAKGGFDVLDTENGEALQRALLQVILSTGVAVLGCIGWLMSL